MMMHESFYTCTQTYNKYKNLIYPFPQNPESISAIEELYVQLLNAITAHFGEDKFNLTYGFCSVSLIKYLNKKDPATKLKNGRICPAVDQHTAFERDRKGNYICKHPGAACDFLIKDFPSNQLVEWILDSKLPFDAIYYYALNRPIHLSYGSSHRRDMDVYSLNIG
ncbi:hypothetical protein [Anabaena azotica]|uniref:Peptidase M15A C-terminal domain-containing protein n=1 Tax=Anabaena azotica FACHB-119 TaxID=947527 RepID=A0ABR8D0F5_9NOST|nr:hypothetical protein [Anabaena azotica]MBD2499873.1 hypothetical protein [Anabaena azotica FACHB-119]